MAYRTRSKYSSQQSSEIRFNMLAALQELATFNGIDINTMKTTPPYATALYKVPSQKMAAELKKLIDTGMVVKSIARGKTVKYMLKDNYKKLLDDGKVGNREFGYGDYRDTKEEDFGEDDEEISQRICERILLSATRTRYEEMW